MSFIHGTVFYILMSGPHLCDMNLQEFGQNPLGTLLFSEFVPWLMIQALTVVNEGNLVVFVCFTFPLTLFGTSPKFGL